MAKIAAGVESVKPLPVPEPELPWFISEQHENATWHNMDSINAALNDVARSDSHVTIIKTARLPHDRRHFGTKGTPLLGEEMANAYLKSPQAFPSRGSGPAAYQGTIPSRGSPLSSNAVAAFRQVGETAAWPATGSLGLFAGSVEPR